MCHEVFVITLGIVIIHLFIIINYQPKQELKDYIGMIRQNEQYELYIISSMGKKKS